MESYFGGSPGCGTTEAKLSAEPLASEGEATPGPDDYNPFEDDGFGAGVPVFDGDVPGDDDGDGFLGDFEPELPFF